MGACYNHIADTYRGKEVAQTINGKVYDNPTNESLPFATIIVVDSDPLVAMQQIWTATFY